MYQPQFSFNKQNIPNIIHHSVPQALFGNHCFFVHHCFSVNNHKTIGQDPSFWNNAARKPHMKALLQSDDHWKCHGFCCCKCFWYLGYGILGKERVNNLSRKIHGGSVRNLRRRQQLQQTYVSHFDAAVKNERNLQNPNLLISSQFQDSLKQVPWFLPIPIPKSCHPRVIFSGTLPGQPFAEVSS